jgi:DNA ligase-1
MASSKRSLSNFDDKQEFSFIINDGIIEYPKLFSKINKSDKIRYWFIYAILMNKNDKIKIKDNFIDLEKFKDFEEKHNYKNLKVYIYTEYGQIDVKITETSPTIIDIGKNLNKKNETSIITQSIIHMRNLYLKKIKSGYILNFDDLNKESIDNKVFPMAVHEYSKYKKYIKYPCYIQPKLDGIRIIAKYDKNTDTVLFLSRRLNDIYGFENIKEEAKKIFKLMPNIILDGEFYNHDMNLQEISGIVRHQDIYLDKKKELKFYIFDFIDLENKLTFEERINILYNLFLQNPNMQFITLTETRLIDNENESDKLFKESINNKYEGIVYKNKDALYEYSSIKEKRSFNYIKRKNHHDEEYEIVGFESGIHGKDMGAIVFIMQTKDGKQFKSVPNMSLDERKDMYNLAKKNFDNLYKNKMATISFDDYSKDNIPLRAKFITIRDYE